MGDDGGELKEVDGSRMKRDDCFVAFYASAVECDASCVARGGIRIGWISTFNGGEQRDATRAKMRRITD